MLVHASSTACDLLWVYFMCWIALKILRKIHGPKKNPDGTWRNKINNEMRHRMKQEDIIEFIKS